MTEDELYIYRYNLLLKEVDRILSLSEDEIYDIYIKCIDIIKYNYELLYNQRTYSKS